MKLYLSLALAVFLLSINVAAQHPEVTVEPSFSSAVQPVVLKLPLPQYPKISQRLSGNVSVPVTIDEGGNVALAGKVTGPFPVCLNVTDPAVITLRAAAEDAAKAAKFQPIVVGGPVNISGRINYVFTSDIPEESIEITPATVARVSPGTPAGKTATLSTPNGRIASGGVLNGTAMELAKPEFPPAAKAVRASGAVSVQLLILEDGTTYSAKAVSGHPLLRGAAEIAACSSKFQPTLLSGSPVKISGVITYNFVP